MHCSAGPAKSQGPETKLRLSELLRDSVASGMIVLDPAGRIVGFDAGAERLTGLSAAAFLGRPHLELPPALRELVVLTLESGKAVTNQPLVLPASSPPGRMLAVATHREPTSGAVIVALAGMNAPALEQGLTHLNRLASVGATAAISAHELKNALVAVKLFVDVALTTKVDASLAELAQREIQRIISLITQMLEASAPESSRPEPLHLHDVIRRANRVVSKIAESRGIAVHHSFRAASDVLPGFGRHLEQAFLNLFLNATAATDHGGELRVETESVSHRPPHDAASGTAPGRALRITVSDTGHGISPEVLPRLFQPFFTTKADGTGLGLAITRRIIEEHGGSISVASEVGHGTTFTILLPQPMS